MASRLPTLRPAAGSGWSGRRSRLGQWLAAHGTFLAVLAAAVIVRTVAVRGYPAPWWFGDSHGYITSTLDRAPGDLRPSGYPFLLWLLEPFHSFTVVVVVQHAIGVLTGVLVYLLAWRAGRAAWPLRDERGRAAWRVWLPGLIGAAVTVPVLLPVQQIALEHMVMSDFLFAFLLPAAVAVVLWRERMTWWTGGVAGLLMAAQALTRSAGLPLIAVLLVAMVVRKAGLRACVAAVAAFGISIVSYMAWFHSYYGSYSLSTSSPIWLYGRTAAFADCDVIKPRPELRIMCPKQSNPRISPAFSAMWTPDSPFRQIPGWVLGKEGNTLAGEFAWAAIKAQPGDYLQTVARDTLRAFEWERKPYPTPWTWHQYEFPKGEEWEDRDKLLADRYDPSGGGRPRLVELDASRMLAYQRHMEMPGTFLGVMLLAGLGGMVLHVRVRGRRLRPGAAVTHWARTAMLPWGMSLALLVIPAATADFDYRYVTPAVPLAAIALTLALIPRPPRVDEGGLYRPTEDLTSTESEPLAVR